VVVVFQSKAQDLLAPTSKIYPGPNGNLVYAKVDKGNQIPDFSNAGYLSLMTLWNLLTGMLLQKVFTWLNSKKNLV
jgi:hypothetical protein